MNEQPRLTPLQVRQVEHVCDRFEADLKAARHPSLEEFLAEVEQPLFETLLRELLALELAYRACRGEMIDAQDYVARFPGQAALVETLFHANPAASTLAGSPARADQIRFPAEFGDYVLLEEIARGGMGVVYRARQKNPDRIVALKTIRAGQLAGDEELQRFHEEAMSAAQLDHPGIVPIFEVGESNGQQFFTMGFVDGVSLHGRLQDGPLTSQHAAGIVQTVAIATEYAHRKNIVHRDLKPANILLDETGQPKITDFGLAKRTTTTSGLTVTGEVIGTPSFMSPEQAVGQSDAIGPLADVYSLGATLYCLLTGRPPFGAANVVETLRQVIEDGPVAPRTLNPSIDRDLETICLKCLDKVPGQRYRSAAALADDLQRYLDRKPIVARPVGKIEAAWKWCRRKPVAATLFGLVAGLAVAGPSIAVWMYLVSSRLRHTVDERDMMIGRLDETNTKLTSANEQLRTKQEELRQSVSAESAANRRAKRNLDRADAVVRKFVTDIGEEGGPLSRYPATQILRRKLLEMGREYYRKLIEENPDAELSFRLAVANYQLAYVEDQLSGRKEKAIEAYQKAIGLLKMLVGKHSDSDHFQFELAACYNNVGVVYKQTGDLRRALAAYTNALAIREKMARRKPDDIDYQHDLATAYYNLAGCHSENGNPELALAGLRKALEIRKRLATQYPAMEKIQQNLASSYHAMALHYFDTGEPALALDTFAKAEELLAKLVRQKPMLPDYRNELARCQLSAGHVYHQKLQFVQAMHKYRESQENGRKLIAENPDVPEYQFTLALCEYYIANLHAVFRNTEKGLAAALEVRTRFEQLVRANPTVTAYRHRLAETYSLLALYYRRSQRIEDAIAAHRQSIRSFEQINQANPNDTRIQSALATSRVHLAMSLRNENPHEAAKLLGGAIQALNAILHREPLHRQAKLAVANAHWLRATVFDNLERYPEALKDWQLAARLAPERYQNGIQRNLCMALARCGHHREATNLADKLIGRSRDTARYDLACVFAVSSVHVKHDLEISATERVTLSAGYLDSAMKILKSLGGIGFFRVESHRLALRADPDLNVLRQRADFRAFTRGVGVNLPVWANKPRSAKVSQ